MKKKSVFIALNIGIPLFIGAVLYYLMSPETIFVEVIDRMIGREVHGSIIPLHNGFFRFVRFYFLDMCWGYALIISLHTILSNNTTKLVRSFLLAVIFSASLEFLQMTPMAKGTFDVFDILCEVLAEGTAVCIIKKYAHEEAAL